MGTGFNNPAISLTGLAAVAQESPVISLRQGWIGVWKIVKIEQEEFRDW